VRVVPWRAVVAEGVGVFFIVLAGGGAILAGANALAVASAFAFTVAVLVYALGHVSGAHYNPAVTVAFAATGHFPWRVVPWYLASQAAGAIVASATLLAIFDSVDAVVTTVRPGLGLPTAFLVESLATAMLAFVIIAVATDRRAAQGMAGLAIGLSVGVGALWAGPLTGASMNPARSLGPAVVGMEWGDALLYLVAPVIGAVVGMAGYELLRTGEKPQKGETLGALGPLHEDPGRRS
jgi:aquaporin NIP